jgi:hypothetical protein
MLRTRRTGALALAASLALAAGAVTASIPAAAIDPPPPSPQFVNAGVLTLSTASKTVTFDQPLVGSPPVAPPTVTQPLGNPTSGCIEPTPTPGNLLTFTGIVGASPAKAGYKGNSIGVNEKYAILCNLVDPVSASTGGTETLELKLGTGLVNFAGRPLTATKASLDLEVGVNAVPYIYNKKATVQATAWLDTRQADGSIKSVQVGNTFTLIQGATPTTLAPYTTYCDVAYAGNCKWDIALPAAGRFDTLKLKSIKGAFSLQGGSDVPLGSTVPVPTTFDLVSEVDAVVPCEEGKSVTQGTTTVTYQGGGTCTEVGIVVKNQDQEVTFLKPSNDPNAKFVLDVKWTIPVPTGLDAIPNTTVNFVATDHPIGWCAGAVIDTSGNLTGATVGADLEPDLTGDQYACVGKQSANIKDGKLEVNEQIFLVGDVALRK